MAYHKRERPHTPQHEEHADSWHRHDASSAPQAEHGATLNTSALMLAFVLTVVGVFAVSGAILVYWLGYTSQLRRDRLETTILAKEYWSYKQSADTALAGYGVVDPKARTVSIPIDQAMRAVLDRYGDSGAK